MNRAACWMGVVALVAGGACKGSTTPEVAPLEKARMAALRAPSCAFEPDAAAGPPGAWATATNVYQIYPATFTEEGTIAAMTEKVGYLQGLGVKTIWLMPIFQASSAHGYDTTDYRQVQPSYGTKDDLVAFVCAAHEAKMRVLLDLVLNHTSKEHPWFSGSEAQRHDDWYFWKETSPGWGPPWPGGSANTWPKDPLAALDRNHDENADNDDFFYCAFCDNNDSMPDLDWKAALALREVNQPSPLFDEVEDIMASWVAETKIDGYRVDAARYLVEHDAPPEGRDQAETHRVWQKLRSSLSAVAPDAVLVAEAPTETYEEMSAYYGSAATPEFHGAFHFKYQSMLMDSVKNEGRPPRFFQDLYAIQSHLPRDPTSQVPLAQDFLFLSNHDRFAGERVATQVGGFTPKTKLAASLMLLLSGNPVIYYGEELGAENDPPEVRGEDSALRGPMSWRRAEQQKQQPDSVYNHYAALLRLRNHYPALASGLTYALHSKSGSNGAFDTPDAASNRIVLLREYFGQKILVAHNLAAVTQDVYANLAGPGLPSVADNSVVGVLMGGGSNQTVTAANRGNYFVGALEPHTTRVLFLGSYPIELLPTPLYEPSVGGWSEAWLRGTSNDWGTTAMTRGASGLWEVTAELSGPNPRFKISRHQDWTEAYPATDHPLVDGAGWYRIVFDDAAKAIGVRKLPGPA